MDRFLFFWTPGNRSFSIKPGGDVPYWIVEAGPFVLWIKRRRYRVSMGGISFSTYTKPGRFTKKDVETFEELGKCLQEWVASEPADST